MLDVLNAFSIEKLSREWKLLDPFRVKNKLVRFCFRLTQLGGGGTHESTWGNCNFHNMSHIFSLSGQTKL